MPTYAYACTSCENSFEVHQSFSDDALTECERCQGRLRKLFSSVGIVFKGSGFYRTDSRKDGAKVEAGSSATGGKDATAAKDGASTGTASSNGSTGSTGSSSDSGSKGSTTSTSTTGSGTTSAAGGTGSKAAAS